MSKEVEFKENGLVTVRVTFNKGMGQGVYSYSVDAESEKLAQERVDEWLAHQGYEPEDYE